MRDASSLFISDLHLCPAQPGTANLFFKFLDLQARQAEALYILGDLFEYWAGDDDFVDPFNASICYALKDLAKHGTAIFFLPGNRDFLAGEGFAETSGVELIGEPYLITLFGKPTMLLHGDTLCSDDVEYGKFRAEVHDPAWRKTFLALPLAERKAQIEEMRRRSEEAKQIKPADIMDVNNDTVAELLRAHDYPRLIHGHTHRQSCYTHIVDGRRCQRWVLGDWGQSPRAQGKHYLNKFSEKRHSHDGNYLACDETGLAFHALGKR